MPRLEIEIERAKQSRCCVACRHWELTDELAFKPIVRGEFPARRCNYKSRLFTFPDDRCDDWAAATLPTPKRVSALPSHQHQCTVPPVTDNLDGPLSLAIIFYAIGQDRALAQIEHRREI